jgi:DNA-binding MarR family transcriptional regulator
VDAVLAASRSMIALGATAGEPTAAQYRALKVLESRSQWRLADLAASPGVAPSSAGRMCDRLACKGLVRARRASGDRRTVLAGILARFPAPAQRAVAEAFRDLAAAAGEVPAGRWQPAPAGALVPRSRPTARPGRPVPPVSPIQARAQEQP